MLEDHQDIPAPAIEHIPEELPLLPVRDIVVFPYMVLPLFVGRELSIKAIEAALSSNRLIFLTTQKNQDIEMPEATDLYRVGTVGVIMRMLKLPDARIKVLVQGLAFQPWRAHNPVDTWGLIFSSPRNQHLDFQLIF